MKKLSFIFLCIVAIISLLYPTNGFKNILEMSNYNLSDTVWVMLSSSLVFLMTPGLSFFYGGMVSSKNILSTMIKSFITTGVVSILWLLIGFSLAFGSSYKGLIGNPFEFIFFNKISELPAWPLASTIPFILFAIFQMKFAIITPALVVGAIAERVRFTSYIVFVGLFIICVYSPIAHWTWHPQGFLFKLGILDFAGGIVVHISAGCAALAGAIILKKRKNNGTHQASNIPFVLLGTGLLWFGWFGFNGGSALAVNKIAINAMLTTNIASAVAGLTWVFWDNFRGKKISVLNFCIGAVVGLVAITPAAGYVSYPISIVFGFVSALLCNIAAEKLFKISVDDTLDVFVCHGLGGIIGMILTGIFANKISNPTLTEEGVFYSHNFSLFNKQIIGLLVVVLFSFIVSLILFKVIDKTIGLRVNEEEEKQGLDLSQHGESF